jgi:hypothetical protein
MISKSSLRLAAESFNKIAPERLRIEDRNILGFMAGAIYVQNKSDILLEALKALDRRLSQGQVIGKNGPNHQQIQKIISDYEKV